MTCKIELLNKNFPIWNQEITEYERRSMLARFISDVLKKRGLSIRKASIRTSVSFSHFAKIVRGDTAIPQPSTLDAICAGLNLQYSYIFAITGWFKIFIEDDKDKITPVIRNLFENNGLEEVYVQCINNLDFNNEPDFGLFFLDILPSRFYSDDTPNFARKLQYFKKAVKEYIDFIISIEELENIDIEELKAKKEPSYFFDFVQNSYLTLIESKEDILFKKDQQKTKKIFQKSFREIEEKEEKNKPITITKKEVTKPILEIKSTQYGYSVITILVPDNILLKFIPDLSRLLDEFNNADEVSKHSS